MRSCAGERSWGYGSTGRKRRRFIGGCGAPMRDFGGASPTRLPIRAASFASSSATRSSPPWTRRQSARGGSHFAGTGDDEFSLPPDLLFKGRAMLKRLRERNEWKFFAVLLQADGGLAFVWWLVLLLRGVLPAVFAI